MKKVFWVGLVVATAGYIASLPSPLNDTFNFIIGGTIPGTSRSLGFWPFMSLVLIAIVLLIRFLHTIRLQMLEGKAKQIKAEQLKEQSQLTAATEEVTFDLKQRSVIAAPSLDSIF